MVLVSVSQVTATQNVTADGSGIAEFDKTVSAPSGTFVTGGGWKLRNNTSGTDAILYPRINEVTASNAGWRVKGTATGSASDSFTLTVYACYADDLV